MSNAKTKLAKGLLYSAAGLMVSTGVLVAQDAMVMGGSSLPPGVAPKAPAVATATPASAPAIPATSPFAPRTKAPTASTPQAAPASAPSSFTSRRFAPAQPAPSIPTPLPSAPAMASAAPAQGLPALTSADMGFGQEPSFGAPSAWQPPQRTDLPAETRGYYPGRADKGQGGGLRGAAPARFAQASGGTSLPPGVTPDPSVPPQAPAPRRDRPRSWSERLGLGNISTKVFGHAKGGAAARDESTLADPDGGWEADAILDGYLGAEVSAITQGGLEYGVAVGLRGAYDSDGPLFGGQVGGCPVGAVCPGQVTLGGQAFALRGHTSQLFTGLEAYDHDSRLALETAHLFLRSGYGDVTVGRDVGAAELFSLGAPTVLELGLSNGRADYTSLSVAKSTNDPTAFSEKVTFTTPRLGGDRIGIGLQAGASFTPDVDACGAYTCVRRNGSERAVGSIGATLEDAWEVGVALDRTMGDLKAELTATYAQAGLKESLAAFDDLRSWGLGAEVEWGDFTLGGGYLASNNALTDGDYTSWDLGVAYRFGALGAEWGVSGAYASAEDENVGVESDEWTFGVSRSFGDIHVGTGLQRVTRDVPTLIGGVATLEEETSTAVFIETGWSFE